MKKLLVALFLSLASLSFVEGHFSLPNQDVFDKYWKLVEEHSDDGELIQEWIPAFEDEENWSKSFGVQSYQLIKDYDLKYFHQMFMETLKKDFEGQEDKLSYEIMDQDDKHILFSWWCDAAGFEIQREWVHLLKGDDRRVVFVRFATKELEVQDKDQPWRECLTNASFLEPKI